MPDALDPEPTDKRTSEWKAWRARQGAEAPSAAFVMPDPNVFGATFAAGLTATGLTSDRLSHVKIAWGEHLEFMDWVNSGAALTHFAQVKAEEKARADRKAAQAAKDAAAEKAQRDRMRDEFGAKTSALAT